MRLTHLNLARGFRGGERQTELLIRELAAAGWAQRLVCRRGEPLAARLADVAGLELRPTGAGIPGAVMALAGAGLVHSHEGRGLQAAWLNARLRGVPYVVTRRVQKGPRHTWLNRRLYPDAAAVVALSGAIRDALVALRPGMPVTLIPSAGSDLPVAPGAPERIRAAIPVAADQLFLVGHVGALDDSHKGQGQIIELARRLPGMHFVLVGGGRDEAALRSAAAGLGNLHFAGQVDNVGDWLAAFDVFLFPSRHEGLGSILLDALARGLPVVATKVGGIPDIIRDGENGTLCAGGDLDCLAGALVRLRDDGERRARVRAANLDRARDFSAAVMAGRYDALYRRLAAGPAAGLELPPGGRATA